MSLVILAMLIQSWFTLVLILGAVQAFFLLVVLYFKSDKLSSSTVYLIWFIGVIFLSLILRIFYDYELYIKYPHVSEAGDFVMFVFGPVLFLYIKSLLYSDFKPTIRVTYHFIPFLIFMVALSYLITIESETLIAMKSSVGIKVYYIVLLSSAIIQNSIYVLLSIKETLKYKREFYKQNSDDLKVRYLLVLLILMLISISIWSASFISSMLIPFNINAVNTYYQIAFLILAVLSFVIAYFAIIKSEIVQISDFEKKEKYKYSSLLHEDIVAIKDRLEKSLGKGKLYMDPKLSLSKLALAINTNQVHLSRVINETYGKNFFELVNEYRIKDFINKALSDDYNKYTYLGIALESGFSTKTTFNKAFKKVTKMTPRLFFKTSNQLIKKL